MVTAQNSGIVASQTTMHHGHSVPRMKMLWPISQITKARAPATPLKVYDCTYCSGAWVSAGVFAAWHWGGPVAWWILVAVAVAGAQALLNAADGRL